MIEIPVLCMIEIKTTSCVVWKMESCGATSWQDAGVHSARDWTLTVHYGHFERIDIIKKQK